MKGKERLSEFLEVVEDLLKRLPNPLREQVRSEISKLRRLIVDARSPKIMILGRRGAGKSSLINAICGERVAEVGSVYSQTGEPKWYDATTSRGKLRVLDTRGLGDRTKPESANFDDALDEIKASINQELPDVILFLCKAKDADARISEDISNVHEIVNYIRSVHSYDIPIAAIVTQVDELDPKRIEPPFENETKQKNIRSAVSAIQTAFEQSKIDLLRVIPVSAYSEFNENQLMFSSYWNIDKVVGYLSEVLPEETKLILARVARIQAAQIKVARAIIGSVSAVCAAIAATPIPIADIVPITSAQIGMIIGIAYIGGREMSYDSAKEFLVALGINVGAAFVLREAARALIKFVFPGGGSVISAGVAVAGTWGIGEAAIAYYIEGASIEEARARFSIVREKRLDPPQN